MPWITIMKWIDSNFKRHNYYLFKYTYVYLCYIKIHIFTNWIYYKNLDEKILLIFLLLLLSHFSHVRLYATPKTAAHQDSPVPGILLARTLE